MASLDKQGLMNHLEKEHRWGAFEDWEFKETTVAELRQMHGDEEVSPENVVHHKTRHRHLVVIREERMLGERSSRS